MARRKKKPQGKVIRLPRVRLSFPDVYEPRAIGKNDEPAYGATFLLDPKNPKHLAVLKEFKPEIKRLIEEYWGEEPPGMKPIEFYGKGELCVSKETGEIYDGYEGMYFVRAKSAKDKPPILVDKNGDDLPNGSAKLYGGVFVNATINLYIQDNEFGQGIRCALRGIKTLEYGEPFGSRVSAKELEDFDDDDEDDLGEDDGL